MFGVTSEILERDVGSWSGEEAFFSVARTMPLVAGFFVVSLSPPRLPVFRPRPFCVCFEFGTFYAEGCDALVHGVQRIF